MCLLVCSSDNSHTTGLARVQNCEIWPLAWLPATPVLLSLLDLAPDSISATLIRVRALNSSIFSELIKYIHTNSSYDDLWFYIKFITKSCFFRSRFLCYFSVSLLKVECLDRNTPWFPLFKSLSPLILVGYRCKMVVDAALMFVQYKSNCDFPPINGLRKCFERSCEL